MKPGIILALILAGMTVRLTSQAGTVVPGDIPDNISPMFTTTDTLLTLRGYSDSAATVPENLGSAGAGNWFGVGANQALDGTETMTMQFAPGVGLTGFGDIYTHAVITISGLLSDPGLNAGSNPGVNSSSFSAGVLTLDLSWEDATSRDYTLANASASAGQLLTFSLDSATAPQWAVTHIDYGVVPEPPVVAIGLLAGLAAFGCIRRFGH